MEIGDLLMYPTEFFWAQLTVQTDPNAQDLKVAQAVIRSFAALSLFFTLPFFVIGKLLNNLCVTRIPNRQEVRLRIDFHRLQGTEITRAADNLRQLQEFLNTLSWEGYQNLSLDQKYLISGRYTYSYFFGWTISTKFSLHQEFEEKMRGAPDLTDAREAVNEAIQIQEKILFVNTLKEALSNGQEIDGLERQAPQTFKQCLYYIAKEHGCMRHQDPVEFGNHVLQIWPRDQKTTDGLGYFISWLKGAYPPDDLPEMNLS